MTPYRCFTLTAVDADSIKISNRSYAIIALAVGKAEQRIHDLGLLVGDAQQCWE